MRQNDKRMIRRLREYYSLPSYVSDDEITDKLDNSLGADRIRLYYSFRIFIKSFKIEVLKLFRSKKHD